MAACSDDLVSMLGRRDFLVGSTAIAIASCSPKRASADDEDFRALLDEVADTMLGAFPELATVLGLDTGQKRSLRGRFSDRSEEGVKHGFNEAQAMLGKLRKVNSHGLSVQNRTMLASVTYAFDLSIAGAAFSYGDNGFEASMGESATPYIISDRRAAILSTPDFLDSVHPVESTFDAEMFLERLSGLATLIDQETVTFRRDAARGIIAPAFILDNAINQIQSIRKIPADRQGLTQTLIGKTKKAGLDGDWGSRAQKIVASEIFRALDRQIEALAKFRSRAGVDAGVWRLPDGEAYYQWLLRVGTTTSLSSDEIHRLGLEQTREISSRMDALLRSQGLSRGSVGERIQELNRDPKNLFTNDDAGRAKLLAYLNDTVASLRPVANRASKLGLKAPVEVRRVPVEIQDGAPGGYGNPGALDGSRPFIYYINLKEVGNWPRWTLPTLTAHETIPGHAWQGAYLSEYRSKVPTIVSLMGFNAFIEGWALYAEQLVDELGFYDADPLGRLGYLQAQQFRACRLVVDTGIHSKRWARETAIDWMVDNTGRTRDAMASEIDRYCVIPGQATGYKVGHNRMLELRDRSKRTLGPNFDLGSFNDVMLRTGGVPLDVLTSVVDGYLQAGGQ